MRRERLPHGVWAVVFVALAACGGKGDGATGTNSVPAKEKLDPATECAGAFDKAQKSGDKDKYMAACKKDMSLIACAGEAAGSGFCKRAMEDPAKKHIIDDMKAALGK